MKLLSRSVGGAWLTALALALACSAPAPPARRPRDPAADELGKLLARPPPAKDLPGCLAALERRQLCPAGKRTVSLRIGLDPRYRRWPRWRQRLGRTLACTNALYARTGIRWRVVAIEPWDPGAERHQLYPLLARLQRELASDGASLRIGITVWEPRRVYRMMGGEIGLAQRDACVVPSWPRTENDCVILAHELGHLIGAEHVSGKRWIMGWAARPFHLPAKDALARVQALYRFHPRNRAAIAAHATASFSRGLRPTPRCRRYIAELDRCYGR